MPHTGKPSGACQNCKQRHVKCDEARPACGKCVKAKRVCSGYAEGLDLVLRDQNEAAKAGVGRRQKAQALKKSRSKTPESQLIIAPFLPESEDSHAVCFFISTFVLYPRDTQADRGFLEFLPVLFNNLRVDSPLSLALTASAYVLFGKWERNLKNIEYLAFPFYGKALEATRLALQDPAESLSDETLMAVCLLGFYEAATNAFRSRYSPVRHFSGAAALIERRQDKQMMTGLSTRLLLGVRSNIVFRAMQFSTPIDTTSRIWRDFDEVPKNPATLLDLMSVEVANLLATAKHMPPIILDESEEEDEVFSHKLDLMMRAQVIDAQLATWPDIVPSHWRPVKLPASEIPKNVIDAGIYGDGCDIYPDIIICSTWNDYRVARLKVLGLIAGLDHGKSLVQTIDMIQQLVDDIVDSVPFSLGSRIKPEPLYEADVTFPGLGQSSASKAHQKTSCAYGGWYLFSPFKEVMQSAHRGYLRAGQKEWMHGQLQRLAFMYDVQPS